MSIFDQKSQQKGCALFYFFFKHLESQNFDSSLIATWTKIEGNSCVNPCTNSFEEKNGRPLGSVGKEFE